MGRKQSQSAEALWRDRLLRFRKSGLTVKEFCRREGVSDPSFYQWQKRLRQGQLGSKQVRRSGAARATKSEPFVPVKVFSSVLAEIEFPNGVRIRVPATNLEALRAAIQAGDELLPDVWKAKHPQHARDFRAEERQERADDRRDRRAKRRIEAVKSE